MNCTGWSSIGTAENGDVALAVDVDGTTRREATFRDLAPMLDQGWDVRLTLMPDVISEASADDALDVWLHDCDQWAFEVGAVLGYCVGGLFALAIADRVEDVRGVRPEVILFDPERPTSETFHRDFTSGLNEMSALHSEERDAYSRRAHCIVRKHGSDLKECVHSLSELYGEACRANLSRLGIASDIAADLEKAFKAYGSYILGASRIGNDVRWSKVTVLVSANANADDFNCQRSQIDVDKKDLLRSEAAAAQVRGLLERAKA